jgi:phosphoribosylamine--glycine ligase
VKALEDSSRPAAAAKAALAHFAPPYVVKADGLAAGKGVVIAPDRTAAEAAIDDAFGGGFGAAGARVVIEEFLEGEIGSLFALCDGKTSMLFGWAQDHKRAFDGDEGPNTGGMGTYSPAPVFTYDLVEQTRTRLVEPAFKGIAADGAPYRGVLFVELMSTRQGPKLIEFNARFGDPECQVLMLRLESDLVPYLLACATGRLHEMPEPKWRDQDAVCVVLATEGYPGPAKAGSVIRGLDADFGEGVVVFHAGTTAGDDGAILAGAGRALNVCATGKDFAEARERAYGAVALIDWPQGFRHRLAGARSLAPWRSGALLPAVHAR